MQSYVVLRTVIVVFDNGFFLFADKQASKQTKKQTKLVWILRGGGGGLFTPPHPYASAHKLLLMINILLKSKKGFAQRIRTNNPLITSR